MRTYDHDLLFRAYLRQIVNLDIPNPKFYITFSAVTGAGKSTVARYLAGELKGLFLSADDVRTAAKTLWPDSTREELDTLIAEFAPTIQNRLIGFANKLHIVDTSVDRYYEAVFKKAEELAFPLYIISIDIPKQIIVDRLDQRDALDDERRQQLLESLDEKIEQHKRFVSDWRSSISYYLNGTSTEDLSRVLVDVQKSILMNGEAS